jgi:hypothetical protein
MQSKIQRWRSQSREARFHCDVPMRLCFVTSSEIRAQLRHHGAITTEEQTNPQTLYCVVKPRVRINKCNTRVSDKKTKERRNRCLIQIPIANQ